MSLKPRGMIPEDDPKVCQVGHPAPAWMVNYADLMTELVCFYLILYALSASLSKPMQEAKKEVEENMKQQDVAADVKMTKDGLVISLQEQGYHVFFKSGSAELSDEMKKILDGLAPTFKTLAEKNHDMIVEGHTDDVPVRGGAYASNWELSTGRSTNVVQYLLKTYNYPPKHIAAIGYGDNKSLPQEEGEDLDAWRSKNRRVVFVIKNPDTSSPAGKTEEKSAEKKDEKKDEKTAEKKEEKKEEKKAE